MPTNNNINYGPAPIPGAVTTPVLGNNIDRAPAPVSPGAGTGVNAPMVTAPVIPVTEQPVLLPPAPTRVTPVVLPVAEVAVDTTANAVAGPNITAGNQPRYITILANGAVVTNNASSLNFAGNGFLISNLGTTGATITINAEAGGYGNTNVTQLLAGFGSNTLSTTGNVTAGYVFGNGSQLTGISAGANTGNIGFTGDAIYDLNGMIIENADLSHGATAAVILPANGNTTAPIQINNTYGNITLTAGTSPSQLKTWIFGTAGNLYLPGGGSIENRDDLSILITNETVQDGEITLAANAAVNIYGGSTTTAGSAGGRVNVAGGDGGPDDGDNAGNGGEVEITGGTGASAIDGSAGAGGDVRIVGGLGGAANAGNSLPAETGGQVYIFGGQAGDVDGDNALAINGPDVEIHGGLGSFNGSTMVGIPGDVITQGGGNGWIGASGNVLTKTSPDGYDFYVWKYDNAGQTIFPTLSTQRGDTTGGTISGSTIRIGDGTQEAIITTPDAPAESNGNSQRLVINPGQGDGAGEGGDIYLWAGRGGSASGSGGDIKIRGGQGGANTNGGTGGAGGYIRMEAGDAASVGGDPGYIEITGGTGGSGSPGGYLSLTGGLGETEGGGIFIQGGQGQSGPGGPVNITGGVSGNGLAEYGNVGVIAGASGWVFDNTGNLMLPNDGIVYETNIPFGGLEGKTIALKPYGGTNADQQLLVYPTAGADFNHLHLTTGNLWNTEMFLGNDDFYVKLANTGNIVINSNDNTGNTAQWTFGTAGTILNSGNLTLQTPSGVPATVTSITGSSGSWEANPVSNLATTGGTGTGLTVDVTQEGGYAGTIAIHTPGTGYSNGDSISVVSGSSDASFTISVTANGWTLDTAGNLTVAGSIIMPPGTSLTGTGASPAPSINGFSTISSENVRTVSISVEGGRINGGFSTVVTDGINSITSAPGAQMDVFGFPFSAAGVRGQLTISGVTTPSQANGTWYYQSVSDIAYQLYTNSTYSTLVNASGWSAYTGGGSVAITMQDPASNVVINSNGYFSTFDNTGNLTVPGSVKFTSGSALTFGDTPVTNRYYIDATRTDTYTENGSQARPFKTIAAAQAAIATAISNGLNPEVEPVYMILLSNITENVTLETNHVYLIGQNGQIHQPIILTGNITVEPTSGTLNNNHFSISGMEIVGGTNGKAIYVTGTYPTRLSLQDVWITANGNSGAGLYQDNTGTGTYTHGGPIKVSHNGVGDVYCFDIRKGTASFDTVETSGATQVGAAGPGATLTFNNSQLDANGDVVVETYGSGVLVVTNSVIKNAAANSYGIKMNSVANVAGTVSVGQSAFNVPTGTGQAVWLDPNATPGLSGVFAWSGASFYPSTNTTISANVIPGPLPVLVGTQVSPIFYGDITSYAVAQDWDLIDNNASALSFDTTGKAGVLELVTTNSAEGVKMSGYANVVGNITGGNIITSGNVSGNTAGYAIGYRDIPQVSFTGNATIATTDAGKHFYSTQSSNYTLTIANNASQGLQVGSAITVVNQGSGTITVAQGSGVTLYMAGNATSGNRSISTFGMATIMKVATDTWFINGTGVS